VNEIFSYDASHPHAVSGLDGNTYLYDENGNQISRSLPEGEYTLIYDGENRLVEVTTDLQEREALRETPTPTATATETLTPTPEVTLEETPTEEFTPTYIPTPTETPTPETILEEPTATAEATQTGLLSAKAWAAPVRQEGDTPTPTETATETPTPTETPLILGDTETPTATSTATETETPAPGPLDTPTETLTPTVTETPTETTTPTETPTPTQSATPTPTGVPTEPEPELLEGATYVYDGDNNLVKSVVNGKVTYYLGKLYLMRVVDSEVTVQKYYSSGSTQIAVRTIQGEEDILQWLLPDHLGSTSATANADGSWNSTLQYSAFGEIRASSGLTPTEFRYTGQLRQAELGLYYYVARWYDPEIAHFIQADVYISEPYDVVTYNRYSYVTYNPVRYQDPSGQIPCDQTETGCGWFVPRSLASMKRKLASEYGITLADGPMKWDLKAAEKAFLSVYAFGWALSQNFPDPDTGKTLTPAAMAKGVIGNTTLIRSNNDNPNNYSGFTSNNVITFYGNRTGFFPIALITHEYQHVFDYYADELPTKQLNDSEIYTSGGYFITGKRNGSYDRGDSKNRIISGYLGNTCPYQCHPHEMPGGNTADEEWADMGMNLVFGTFANNDAGKALGLWLSQNMTEFIIAAWH